MTDRNVASLVERLRAYDRNSPPPSVDHEMLREAAAALTEQAERVKRMEAVVEAVRELIDNSPIDKNDRHYISEVASIEFDNLEDALAALDAAASKEG